MMKRALLLLAAAFCLMCCKENGTNPGGDPEPDPKPDPKPIVEPPTGISGSFIQHWYVQNWSQSQWDTEMAVLAEAGMTYLVVTPIKESDADADYFCLEKCLKAAQSKGIKVFVGTNFDSQWWSWSITSSWLNERMTEGVEIAREAYRRFHSTYGETLYGWYWDWEIDNASWKTEARKSMLAEAMNVTLDGLSGIDASMPLLFCPFMNPSYGDAKDYASFWKSIFPTLHLRKGDIFCPQDCAGAAGLSMSSIKSWFSHLSEAAKTVDGLLFWADIELFDQFAYNGESRFATASFTRMTEQIEAVKSFVDGIICFAYSHYYSPAVVRDAYHNAYKAYIKDGTLPSPEKPGRVSSAQKEVGTGVKLTWTMATKTDVDGFAIYKNGSVIIKLQVRQGEAFPNMFFDYEGKSSDTYQIAAYNILGNEGSKVSF